MKHVVDVHRGVLIEDCIQLILSILAYCRYPNKVNTQASLKRGYTVSSALTRILANRGVVLPHSKYGFYVRGQLLIGGDDGLRVFAEVP